jgi:ribosomal protein S18 acetylase RimI-like enzyme
MSSPTYTARAATEADASFLAWAIREAEASGTPVVSYQRLFDLTDAELTDLLTTLAAEDAEGQELCYPSHRLLVAADTPVATCAAWVEGADGLPSHLVRAQLLGYVLGPARLQAAAEALQVLAAVAIPRTPGALQLESFAVLPAHRGQGLVSRLIDTQLAHHLALQPSLRLAEIQLMRENEAARRAYTRAGFHVVQETHSSHPRLPQLLPGTGKVLMQRQLG